MRSEEWPEPVGMLVAHPRSFQPTARVLCPSHPRMWPGPQWSSLQRPLAGGAPGAGMGGVPGWDSWRAPPGLHPQMEAAPPDGGCTTAPGGNQSRGQPAGQGGGMDRAAPGPRPGGWPTVATDSGAREPTPLPCPVTETPGGRRCGHARSAGPPGEHHRVPAARPHPTLHAGLLLDLSCSCR